MAVILLQTKQEGDNSLMGKRWCKGVTTGVSTKPATTDGSAPSVPDTTTITSAALTATSTQEYVSQHVVS